MCVVVLYVCMFHELWFLMFRPLRGSASFRLRVVIRMHCKLIYIYIYMGTSRCQDITTAVVSTGVEEGAHGCQSLRNKWLRAMSVGVLEIQNKWNSVGVVSIL